MKDVTLGTCLSGIGREFVVKIVIFPELLNFWFTLLRVGPLRERSLRKKNCGCIGVLLLFGSLCCSASLLLSWIMYDIGIRFVS